MGIRRPDYGGRGDKGTCFGVPFRWSSLLEKGKPLLHYRQTGAKAIPKDVPAGPFRQVDCRGRPAVCRRCGRGAQNVVAERFSGTNGGGNPASLGVRTTISARAVHCPGVSGAGRVRWRRRCETGCRSRGSLRSITLRVGEVVDLIIDLPAQPAEINDATPCRLG